MASGLDLKNPGGKEILVIGGGAAGLALIYFALNRSSSSATPAQPQTNQPAPGSIPASGGGLGNPITLPGGQSPTGNAFTDSLVQSPVALATTGTPQVVVPIARTPQGPPVAFTGGGGGGGVDGGGGGIGISGGSPSGGSITNLSGTSPLQWATAVLSAGGFPKTAANLQSLVAWALNEGGGGANNPLNTTQPAAGASTFNSVGVKNYPNIATGVAATVQTLTNGLYSNIVADLKAGTGITSNAAAELSKWSGGGYSSLSGNWARAAGLIQAPPKAATKPNVLNPGTKALTAQQVAGLFPKVTASPVANVKAAPVAKGKTRATTPGFAKAAGNFTRNLVLAFASAVKPKAAPAPRKPAYRPTPARGPGHPLLR